MTGAGQGPAGPAGEVADGVTVWVNGVDHRFPAGAVVADAVASLTSARTGIAVAVNGVVVARGAWATTPVGEGDRVEVLTAVQGG